MVNLYVDYRPDDSQCRGVYLRDGGLDTTQYSAHTDSSDEINVLKPPYILLEEMPCVAAAKNDNLKHPTVCDACFTHSKAKLRRCAGCKLVFYCCVQCQTEHWQQIHHFECAQLKQIYVKYSNTLGDSRPISGVQAHVRLLTHLAWNLQCNNTDQGPNTSQSVMPYNDTSTKPKKLQDMDSSCNAFLHCVSNYKLHTPNQLLRMGNVAVNSRAFFGAPINFPDRNGSADNSEDNLNSGTLDLKSNTQSFLRMICRVSCNAVSVVDTSMDQVGVAIYPKAAMLNHSCNPNCCFVFHGKKLVLRALSDISGNQELTVAYTDLAQSCASRRWKLLEGYKFFCSCKDCRCTDYNWSRLQKDICVDIPSSSTLSTESEQLARFWDLWSICKRQLLDAELNKFPNPQLIKNLHQITQGCLREPLLIGLLCENCGNSASHDPADGGLCVPQIRSSKDILYIDTTESGDFHEDANTDTRSEYEEPVFRDLCQTLKVCATAPNTSENVPEIQSAVTLMQFMRKLHELAQSIAAHDYDHGHSADTEQINNDNSGENYFNSMFYANSQVLTSSIQHLSHKDQEDLLNKLSKIPWRCIKCKRYTHRNLMTSFLKGLISWYRAKFLEGSDRVECLQDAYSTLQMVCSPMHETLTECGRALIQAHIDISDIHDKNILQLALQSAVVYASASPLRSVAASLQFLVAAKLHWYQRKLLVAIVCYRYALDTLKLVYTIPSGCPKENNNPSFLFYQEVQSQLFQAEKELDMERNQRN